MVGNRRNLIYKAVIAINVCLLLYGALQLSVGPAPGGEWVSVPITEDVSGNDIHYMSDYFHNDSLDRSSAGERVEQGVNVTTSTSTSTASTVVIEERSTKVDNENVLTAATLNALKGLLGCKDREYRSQYVQRGDYWVLRNFVRAEHGEVRCHETITYTTHSGFEFLENVIPVVERWLAPVSVAIHAPGTDMQSTLDSINHLRKCTPGSKLVRKYVTFHIFFSYKHMPTTIPNPEAFLAAPYNCTKVAPYSVNASTTYKHKNDLLYPINVARNIAREAALTHYVFASDIELYPSRNIVPQFLNMIARNAPPLSTSNNPRVFPINLFEVEATAGVPSTKAELLKMLRNNSAIPFHKYMCSTCHTIPQADKWRKSTGDDRMNILTVSKRHGKHVFWEPIYIGTNQDPYYDERLSWEGMKDKMTQGYILCVQDYDFMILNNAFLIHKPGIKRGHQPKKRMSTVSRQTAFIKAHVQPELHKLYGTRVNCKL